MRRYTTILLAESSGLMAAEAVGLPRCHRLKLNGQNLIIQKCKRLQIDMGMQQTACGFEPKYLNWTIGRDSYSLHPFQNFFWKHGLVSMNSKSYKWENGWKEVKPTQHMSTIKLIDKFAQTSDNEYQYFYDHHKTLHNKEFEQLKVVNEIVTRLHEENIDSISRVLVSEETETKMWSISKWTTHTKTIILVSAALIMSLITSGVIINCTGVCGKCRTQHSHLHSEFTAQGTLQWEDGCALRKPMKTSDVEP